jgi:hypothetical protein
MNLNQMAGPDKSGNKAQNMLNPNRWWLPALTVMAAKRRSGHCGDCDGNAGAGAPADGIIYQAPGLEQCA